ncbi:MAG: hypothetical protein ACLRS8_19195 [Parabacteroides merdae]
MCFRFTRRADRHSVNADVAVGGLYPDDRCKLTASCKGSRETVMSAIVVRLTESITESRQSRSADRSSGRGSPVWDAETPGCRADPRDSAAAFRHRENGVSLFELRPVEATDSIRKMCCHALPTGTSTTDLAVTLNGNGLTPGEYMLPIRLDNVSPFNIAENAVWPVGSSGCRNQVGSCEAGACTFSLPEERDRRKCVGNGVATCLLDGQLSTFWHSQME